METGLEHRLGSLIVRVLVKLCWVIGLTPQELGWGGQEDHNQSCNYNVLDKVLEFIGGKRAE